MSLPNTVAENARAFRQALPRHMWGRVNDTQRIAVMVDRAITEHGWTIPQLVAECMRDHGSANNVGAVITRRLENASQHAPGTTPLAPVVKPPHCGHCDER